MSLEALHTEVQGYRAEAGQLAEEFSGIHTEVADDPNLTPTGKRERLEPLHRQVTEQISALHAREKAAVKAEKERLERKVYGLSPSASNDPARVVSFRDAQARARQLQDGDEAKEVYESALRSGDNILATAVLERALVHAQGDRRLPQDPRKPCGWTAIKDDYLTRSPGTRSDLDDLAALTKYSEPASGFVNTTHYMPPSLNLPHDAGFPQLGDRTAANRPRGVPSLAEQMAQRLGIA